MIYNSVMAGLIIALMGAVNAAVENAYVGAALFSVGLFIICQAKFYLYTGKAGKLMTYEVTLPQLGEILCWNTLACIVVGALVYARGSIGQIAKCTAIATQRISVGFCVNFINAVFCGILIYIAVSQTTAVGIMMPVAIFILSGYAHSIADAFYLTVAVFNGMDLLRCVGAWITVVIGNFVGCHLLDVFKVKKEAL